MIIINRQNLLLSGIMSLFQLTITLPSRLAKHKLNPCSNDKGYWTFIWYVFYPCFPNIKHCSPTSSHRIKFLLDAIFATPLKSNWYFPPCNTGLAVVNSTKCFFLSGPTRLDKSAFFYLGNEGFITIAFISLMLFDPIIEDLKLADITIFSLEAILSFPNFKAISGQAKVQCVPPKFDSKLPT